MAKKKNKEIVRKIISVVSVIGFLLCTAVLLYPVISDRWNRYRDMKLITEYNRTIENTSEDDKADILKRAKDYNDYLRSQNRNIVTDAEYEPDDYYETLLSLKKNGMIGYVEIPKIDITEPVYHYSTDISLGKGVGHIHGSSLPTGGINTHSVLTGHRGLPNQKFFSDLDKMEIGDKFYIHVLGTVLAYRVCNIQTISPYDVGSLMIEEGKDLVTLVTCTPYGVNTHRLLVTGTRIEFSQKDVKDGLVTTEHHQIRIDPAIWVLAGFLLFIIIFALVSIIRKKIYRKRHLKGGKNETT